jgi:hypothetical protein
MGIMDPRQASYEHKHEDVFAELRFLFTPDDWQFFADLAANRVKRKAREKWFLANEKRLAAWTTAQGLLATYYGEDPP